MHIKDGYQFISLILPKEERKAIQNAHETNQNLSKEEKEKNVNMVANNRSSRQGVFYQKRCS